MSIENYFIPLSVTGAAASIRCFDSPVLRSGTQRDALAPRYNRLTNHQIMVPALSRRRLEPGQSFSHQLLFWKIWP